MASLPAQSARLMENELLLEIKLSHTKTMFKKINAYNRDARLEVLTHVLVINGGNALSNWSRQRLGRRRRRRRSDTGLRRERRCGRRRHGLRRRKRDLDESIEDWKGRSGGCGVHNGIALLVAAVGVEVHLVFRREKCLQEE